jgi:GNAT superfamily N-acetyltransferase
LTAANAPVEAASPERPPLRIRVRRARPDDREAVLGFASATWEGWDYIPQAWPDWISAADGVLLVATPLDSDRPLAVARVAMLADGQGWLEGIRVDPALRGRSIATNLQVAELRWAAAQGARVVRYVTGEDNEGSHRLGARHGFVRLADWRSYGPRDETEATPPPWDELTAALRADGLVLEPGDAAVDETWRRIEADATFRAADRLYEHRRWTLVELTRERLLAHVAAAELLTRRSAAGWAAAIRPRRSGWAEDEALHLACLVGDGVEPALDLVTAVERAASLPHRVRLPDPDPPLLRDGGVERFAERGYGPHRRVIHTLARPIDADHPVPEPDAPELLVMAEEPRPVTTPRPIG